MTVSEANYVVIDYLVKDRSIWQEITVTGDNVVFQRYAERNGDKRKLGEPYSTTVIAMGWGNAKDFRKHFDNSRLCPCGHKIKEA